MRRRSVERQPHSHQCHVRPEACYLMNEGSKQTVTKAPAVTLGFWVIKIFATTLGEPGGDTVAMTLN
jgi:hypothetical protein